MVKYFTHDGNEVKVGDKIEVNHKVELPYATINKVIVEITKENLSKLLDNGIITAQIDIPTCKIDIDDIIKNYKNLMNDITKKEDKKTEKVLKDNAEDIFADALLNLFEAWKERENEQED